MSTPHSAGTTRAAKDPSFFAAVFVSGFTALGLEVAWSRALVPWVGGTGMAQLCTVGMYMAGLFFGTLLGRAAARRATAPRTGFLQFEALAILLGWLAILALPWAGGLFGAVFNLTLGGSLGTAALGLTGGILVLPSTICMGWAFPQALRHVDDLGARQQATLLVYGLNTLGAGLGVAAVGFLLVPYLALPSLCLLLVGVDLSVLGWAYWQTRRHADPEAGPSESPITAAESGLDRQDIGLVAAVFFGGVIALAAEVLLFRVLGLLLGPTARAFTSVVTAYVVGLGLGSLGVRAYLARGRSAGAAFIAAWTAAGCILLGLHAVIDRLPDPLGSVLSDDVDFGHQLTVKAIVAVIVLLPLTGAFGAAFAAASALRGGGARRGASLYAVLTLGNVLGLVIVPVLLLPILDLDGGLASLALLALATAALAVFALDRTPRALQVAVVGVLVLALVRVLTAPAWNWKDMVSGPYLYDRRGQWSWEDAVVLHHETTLEATVAVVGLEDNRFYSLDGKVDGSSQLNDLQTQSFVGLLPALLHPDPRRALVIGLGTGQTAGVLLGRRDLQVDCAELLGTVAGTAGWFTKWNGDPFSQNRFRLWRADGRSILRFAPQTYDIIASEPSNLWVPGVAHLFTQEAFEDARARLTPGTGIYAQWLHAYGLDPAVLRSVLLTFMGVFPEVSLWTTSLDRQDLLLVGGDRPFDADPQAMGRIIQASGFQDHIRPGRPLTPTSVLRRFVAGRTVLEREVAGAQPVREQDPGLEYLAERTFRAGRADQTAALHAWLAQLMRQQAQLDGTASVPEILQRRRQTSIRIREVLAADSHFDAFSRDQLETRLQNHLAPLIAALEADPDDDALRLVLGRILQEWGTRFGKAGAHEQGLRVLWHALQAWPKQEAVVGTILDFLSRTGQHEDASRLLERFEQAEPSGPAHRLRGRVAMANGRYDEAIVHFELALQENPFSLNALGNLGLCHRAQGREARAQEYFRRILALDPHNRLTQGR